MGHPHELLLKRKSYFEQLVSKTGTTMSAILQDIARKVSKLNFSILELKFRHFVK